ncbi:alpha/beta hydrolase [Phormidesmis sp. 146-35]
MISQLEHLEGRLLSRPNRPTKSAAIGLHLLRLDGQRDGFRYMPKRYQSSRPAPLILMLHGAGGDAEDGLNLLQPWADDLGIILLSVDSRDRTWDVIVSQYGSDITFIDQALTQTFCCCEIDPACLAIAGFSDGASYALSVGITNGNLFTHVIAFSPGFVAPATQEGQPRLFVSHGTQDPVLPIDGCSRRIVPQLQQAGYEVRYQEFDGSHTVPTAIAHEAVSWFMGSGL